MPSLIAQAAAPSIGTALIETGGVDGAMRVFVASAAVNLMLAAGLFPMLRLRRERAYRAKDRPAQRTQPPSLNCASEGHTEVVLPCPTRRASAGSGPV